MHRIAHSLGNFLSFLFLISISSGTNLPEHGMQEKRIEILSDRYRVEWQANFDDKTIEFTIKAQTEGYVGFGLSTNGQMTGADIVIGGVHADGSHYFNNYHGTINGMPVLDSEETWKLQSANESEGYTHLRIKRALDTCDDEDIQITTGTIKIIWSVGETDTLMHHGMNNRGAMAMNILDPPIPPHDLSGYDVFNFTMELPLNGNETEYWGTVQRRTSNVKSFIVAPKLESSDAQKYTHHFNIYFCKAPNGGNDDEFFKDYIGKPPVRSRSENSPRPYCEASLYAWSFGGRLLVFPDDIGFPWGTTQNEYFLFEVHVNNPEHIDHRTFETGVTFYSTTKKREKEAGLLMVATGTNSALMIPPGTTNWTLVGHCSSECTRSTIPITGINFLNINLHSHLSGRKMKIRHFRGNSELPWIAKDDTYDFNYQENRPMNAEIKFLPGDHLSIECTYDSVWKNMTSVVGGWASSDEMCQAFIFYYPRPSDSDLLEACGSTYPLRKLFNRFGIEEAKSDTVTLDPIVTLPLHLANKTFSQILDREQWTNDKKAELLQELRYSPHETFCVTLADDSQSLYKKFFTQEFPKNKESLETTNMTTYPEIEEIYDEPRSCHNGSSNLFFQLTLLILSLGWCICRNVFV